MRETNRIQRWCGLALCLVVTACTTDALLGPGAAQGIEGIVLLGPQCPVQSEDDPCPDIPYQAWIEIRLASGENVSRFRSGADGRFRIGLRPGAYVLHPESGNPFPVADQRPVLVTDGLYTDVTVNFDTGIR
jgi:hypothetical protein